MIHSSQESLRGQESYDANTAQSLDRNLRQLRQQPVTYRVAQNYTFTEQDSIYSLQVDATLGNITITLPTPNGSRRRRISKIDASANTVTVSAGSNLINGVSSVVLANRYIGVEVEPTNTGWLINSSPTLGTNTGDSTIAAAGTLTGATLAANVVNSSLTALGTIANLIATLATIGCAAFTATSLAISNAASNVSLRIGSFNGAAARDNSIQIDCAGPSNTAKLQFTVGGTVNSEVRTNTAGDLIEFIAMTTKVGAIGTKGYLAMASTTAGSGMNLPHGVAPTSPVNGDLWTTTAGLFVRINGVTVGPLT